MSYHLGALLVALAGFAVTNAFASLAAAALWLRYGDAAGEANSRARLIFLLRVLPTAASLLVVIGLVLPAYGRFEPRDARESFGLGLPALALAALLLIGRGLGRLVRASLATRRLRSDWMREAEPIDLPATALPAYRIPHSFPVVSVLGFVRPRLFVARQVLEGLTPAELKVVLRHEAGHLSARDNLKGLLLRSCADWLSLTAIGVRLERQWAEASESAADDHARRPGAGSSIDLAAALLKVARMSPAPSRLLASASALHHGGSVAMRIARLAADPGHRAHGRRDKTLEIVCCGVAGLLLAVLASSQSAPALHAVYRLSEALVHLLS